MNYSKRYLTLALILVLGGVGLASLLSSTASAQGQIDSRILARAQSVTGDRFTVYVTTPRGANIYALREPSAAMLRAIDDGLSQLFDIARRQGYRARLDHSAYTVFIARPDRMRDSSGGYSPDIAVRAGQYAGSVYDQGGFIYAAGMVLEFNNCVFVIAEHDQNLNRVAEVVRYEGEHLVLYHNDRGLYQRTADHSRGGGHPILK